jgi:hypothetical protein
LRSNLPNETVLAFFSAKGFESCNTLSAMATVSLPDIRIMATPPTPAGVETAQMVSLSTNIMAQKYKK